MKQQIYSVYDKAVGAFLQPFYVRSRGEALRSFMDACSEEKSRFRQHAEDFLLMYHGEYDDVSGVFSAVEPERVISALEVISEARLNDDTAPRRNLPM